MSITTSMVTKFIFPEFGFVREDSPPRHYGITITLNSKESITTSLTQPQILLITRDIGINTIHGTSNYNLDRIYEGVDIKALSGFNTADALLTSLFQNNVSKGCCIVQ